jgi:hypothetical protein
MFSKSMNKYHASEDPQRWICVMQIDEYNGPGQALRAVIRYY